MADDERKIRVVKTKYGKIRSSKPMTETEWWDFKDSDKYDKERDRLKAAARTRELKRLPSYLELSSVFGEVGPVEGERYFSSGYTTTDRDRVLDKVRADERRKDEGLKSDITDCQTDTGINASTSARMRGYYRVGKWPDTNAGKRHAKAQQAEIRGNAEGDLNVIVLRLYCQDSETPANYWTVWVKVTHDRRGMTKQYGRTEEQGEQHQHEMGTRNLWQKDRLAAKQAVICPKCNAPAGSQCTTQPNGDTTTNPHKARVFAYYDAGNIEPSTEVKRDRLGGGHGGYE